MSEYSFDLNDEEEGGIQEDLSLPEKSEDSFNLPSSPEKEKTEIIPLPISLTLGTHSLSFTWGSMTKQITLHLHEQGIDECTSICKELAHCTTQHVRNIQKKQENSSVMVCSQCGATDTPLWRKINSMLVCNACGLYSRTHNGLFRPSKLFKEKEEKENPQM